MRAVAFCNPAFCKAELRSSSLSRNFSADNHVLIGTGDRVQPLLVEGLTPEIQAFCCDEEINTLSKSHCSTSTDSHCTTVCSSSGFSSDEVPTGSFDMESRSALISDCKRSFSACCSRRIFSSFRAASSCLSCNSSWGYVVERMLLAAVLPAFPGLLLAFGIPEVSMEPACEGESPAPNLEASPTNKPFSQDGGSLETFGLWLAVEHPGSCVSRLDAWLKLPTNLRRGEVACASCCCCRPSS